VPTKFLVVPLQASRETEPLETKLFARMMKDLHQSTSSKTMDYAALEKPLQNPS